MGVTARKKGRGQKKSARFARHYFFSIMQCPAYTFALATPLITVFHVSTTIGFLRHLEYLTATADGWKTSSRL